MSHGPFIGTPTPNDNFDELSFANALTRGLSPIRVYYIGAISKEGPVVLSQWIYSLTRAHRLLAKFRMNTPEAGIFAAVCWFNPELENDREDFARMLERLRCEPIEWTH